MVNKLLKFIGLGLALLLLLLLTAHQGWFLGIQRSLQNYFYDFDQASSEIIIVAIDEDSLSEKKLGSLGSWPREYYAQAIETLNQNGAATIGIDITFPNRSSVGIVDDERFKKALQSNDNVVLASYYQDGGETIEWPNESIQAADPTFGWINVRLDDDGFVRQIPVFNESDKGVIEAFSLALARTYLNQNPADYYVRDGLFNFSSDIAIPVVSQQDNGAGYQAHLMYMNYFAKPNQFRRISFADLIEGNLVDSDGEPINFRDKIAIIGPTAIDLQDDYLSPVSSGVRMPGVEIHANAVQTVITQQFLQDQSTLMLWSILLGILILNLVLFSFLRVRYALLVLTVELVGILIGGILAYEYRILANVVYPILASLLSFMGAYLLRFILEQKKRKFIEGAFGHYVNKTVVKNIQANPDLLKLGGVKRDLTVFFSDIEGFTSISEHFQPEELVQFLNEYLGEMTDIIIDQQGTLDKYEGDAIMAFWNAPLPDHDHAVHACFAALENQKKLSALREKWMKVGLPEMHVRIGINTGEAVVGNMGSKNRFDYTAMGDNVNLASRLEGLNKQYHTSILISEKTYQQVKAELVCRELDIVRVKGKREPVRIYELMAKKNDLDPDLSEKIETFESGLKHYRHQEFKEAKQTFERLKDDYTAMIMAKRCEALLKNPPASDWDGVWNFEVK